jgi:hypothetical protein
MTDERFTSPSDILERVVSDRTVDYVTLHEIKSTLHERGFAVLGIIFAVVSAVTPPGITFVPSLPLFFLALQMAAGRKNPWLPAWLGRKKIKRATLAALIEKTTPKLRRIEKLLHRRWTFLASGQAERMIGAFMLVFSSLIILPLPLSNFLPAVGITFMCLGMIGNDGLQVVIGAAVGCIGLCFTLIAMFFGMEAVRYLLEAVTPS